MKQAPRIKKNCNRCLAFLLSNPSSPTCRLGYSIRAIPAPEIQWFTFAPSEPCPKPLTNSAYLRESRNRP